MSHILRPFMYSLYEKIGGLNSMAENQAEIKATWTETQLLFSSWSCMQIIIIIIIIIIILFKCCVTSFHNSNLTGWYHILSY